MAMAKRASPSPSRTFFVDADCHPQTLAVIRTRASGFGFAVVAGDPSRDLPSDLFGALLHYPGASGAVRDHRDAIGKVQAQGALAVVACDLLSLALLTPPGELGADIAIGSAQRFGVPMGYGGPHAAFFATRDRYKRLMPGRLIGVSIDSRGRPALRMALQTREQHIRREKATSNICTAQVLLAVIAGFYAVWHGPEGIRTIAARVHRLSRILALGLRQAGIEVTTPAFFDTITARVPGKAEAIAAEARRRGINLRLVDADRLGIALDETTRRADIEQVWQAFAAAPGDLAAAVDRLDGEVEECLPEPLRRSRDLLSHRSFAAITARPT
jgi:glycine dehydrogenase